MSESTFIKLYASLNKTQKEAVDTTEGPVMVIAGPGTGKTSILTLRIANILRKTDVPPDAILALTFTESGAHSMRKKLVDIIGAQAYRVNIHTFHGFTNELIGKYPEYFPKVVGGVALGEIDQIKIIEEILKKEKFKIIKPYGNIFYYLRGALGSIRTLKRENVSALKFEKLIKKQEKEFFEREDLYHKNGRFKGEMKSIHKSTLKKIEKNKELATVYKLYEKQLLENHQYDYEDMIIEAISALEKHKDFLLELQEEFQYILADEHQDANNAQNRILELLSSFHKSPNLFIVGDEKQAIYRFQGASLDDFLYFKKKYKDAVVISLEANYRSTQSILDASHSLIIKNFVKDDDLRKELKSFGGQKGKPIKVLEFKTEETELTAIAKDIKDKINKKIPPHQITVLYRDNRDAFPIANELERISVPFNILSEKDILEDEEIKKLMVLLVAVDNYGNEELLSKLLFVDFLNIEPLDIYKTIKFSQKERILLADVLKDGKLLVRAGVGDPKKIISLSNNISNWSKIAKNNNLMECLETIINQSGFIRSVISKNNSLEKLEKLDTLLAEVKAIVSAHKEYKLSDFMNFLKTLETHDAKMEMKSRANFEDRVSLMTAHKSKGQEFEYVYIIGVTDGHWGNRRTVSLFDLPIQASQSAIFDKNEDERRLFYVALTRAKKEVTLSYSSVNKDGKDILPSQFIEEIRKDLIEKKQTIKTKTSLSRKIGKGRKLGAGMDIKNKKYLQKLFLDQGLTVTAINNFMECPWKYFFENLIRLPKAPQKHQMFGIAMHSALKEFFDKYRIDTKLSSVQLLKMFERNLTKQPLSLGDYEDSLEKGQRALSLYYEKYKNSWQKNIINEFKISGIFIPFMKDKKLLLRGMLDKIEILSEGGVNVVDYKTGSAKARNDILGETKNSNGNIKRQLDFYKLLLDNFEKRKYKMISGEIDFVEPDTKGRFKKEVFLIGKEESDSALKLTQQIATDIYNLSFWNKVCGRGKCQFCSLRASMARQGG
ncbi:MAG: hypothetical protein CO184_00205 [Candidatus Zambryskibacteria bacterium CG_4_9_14_3_um_filter_40_16]|uniref:DNA 3'-5' helicase n=1 Tax=Candidatus Zambryskibacteria bacterium CG_4_9_14_3_um_filter_40_16 TaxID=1975111 RepID=A0A2M7WVM2_9BACT|nr:MAG: hypothetical protein CO184_00205 [Candidatus Zambryskibacteria bacterium CG_4_9_14_3_um_filter_40_16]